MAVRIATLANVPFIITSFSNPDKCLSMLLRKLKCLATYRNKKSLYLDHGLILNKSAEMLVPDIIEYNYIPTPIIGDNVTAMNKTTARNLVVFDPNIAIFHSNDPLADVVNPDIKILLGFTLDYDFVVVNDKTIKVEKQGCEYREDYIRWGLVTSAIGEYLVKE
jgi:hypothetical protein